jgi:hypothetical protein
MGSVQWPARLEHANLCVRAVDGMIRFLQTAFPEFRYGGEGISKDGTRWVHVGTDATYFALKSIEGEAHEILGAIPGVAGGKPSRLRG